MLSSWVNFAFAFLCIFMLAGGVTLIMALSGRELPPETLLQVLTTPLVMVFYSVGFVGFLIAHRSYRKNDVRKAWLSMILGFSLVIVAYACMELLYRWLLK